MTATNYRPPPPDCLSTIGTPWIQSFRQLFVFVDFFLANDFHIFRTNLRWLNSQLRNFCVVLCKCTSFPLWFSNLIGAPLHYLPKKTWCPQLVDVVLPSIWFFFCLQFAQKFARKAQNAFFGQLFRTSFQESALHWTKNRPPPPLFF